MRHTKPTAALPVSLISMFSSLGAYAGTTCAGPVNYLGVDQSGQVFVAHGGAPIHASCSTVSQGPFQINSQVCKTFHASLLAYRLAGRSATIYYNDPAFTSCAEIGNRSTQPSACFIEANS